MRFNIILRNALAGVIHLSQAGLRIGVSLLGDQPVPPIHWEQGDEGGVAAPLG